MNPDPDPAPDDRDHAAAPDTDYDTSEMLRQVFLRTRSIPYPEARHRPPRPATDPRSS
ncbi:hypothetical protein [Streptomyces sp. NPDC048603]|uniref:hypothetical protein n=1 Tax=Streptomyces sp. NPDC048603 TaxID=3365577 RepID=UPI00372093F9